MPSIPTAVRRRRTTCCPGWKVKERSTSAYVQGDLEGEAMGKTYRGNVGVRFVHTSQTGYGMQSLNGAAPTAVEGGTSYNEILPSLNLIFNRDPAQEQQVRFSAARAMSRAPLDEMRASRNLNVVTDSTQPTTGSAGNPELKADDGQPGGPGVPVVLQQRLAAVGRRVLQEGLALHRHHHRHHHRQRPSRDAHPVRSTATAATSAAWSSCTSRRSLRCRRRSTAWASPSNYAYTTSNIHEQTRR